MVSQNIAVDIIILSLNRSDDTIECIESALSQRGVQSHIVVVDQKSDLRHLERLQDYCAGYDNIKLIKNENNTGVASGRNLGIQSCNNDTIVVIDNDAVFASEWEAFKAASYLNNNSDIGAISFKILTYDDKKIDKLSWVHPLDGALALDITFETTRFVGAGHALNRGIVEKTKLYDSLLHFTWEEMDLSFQIMNLGYRIVYYPNVAVLHKVSPHMRKNWSGDRYYYYVRNAIFIRYKYFNNWSDVLLRSIGYLLKSIRMRTINQYIRAITDVIPMIKTTSPEKLSIPAMDYYVKNERNRRGNIIKRIRREILGKMEGK